MRGLRGPDPLPAGGGLPGPARARGDPGERAAPQEFAEAVKQVGRAASKDEARPILTGVLVEANREGLTLVATDSYRLAVRELTAKGEGETKVLIPERAITEAGRAAEAMDKGEVELLLEDSQATFRAGRLTLTSPADRGRVPELPPADPRGLREPA